MHDYVWFVVSNSTNAMHVFFAAIPATSAAATTTTS